MSIYLVTLVALFGQIVGGYGNSEAARDANGDPIFRAPTIKAEKDSIISAESEGTLIKLPIKEGDRLDLGMVMATIDDRQALAAVDVAKIGRDAAQEKAKDDVEERYAIASKEVAEVDWRKDQEANSRIANSVTDIQIMQKKLVYDRSVLQIEKAKKDQVIAKMEANVKDAELLAAEVGLARRTVNAPFDGEVQEIFQKEAQWVNPGDPVARLVKFDTLRVECYVKNEEFDPAELAGKPVTVKVRLARDREATVQGRVSHISQTVEQGLGAYLVRAEVQNQREGDYWLIRPGLPAQMTIHVSQPSQPQARGASASAVK